MYADIVGIIQKIADLSLSNGQARLLQEREESTSGEDEETHLESLGSSLSKLVFSTVFLTFVSFLTAITMTVVHARLPDQDRYPPLPDVAD